MLRSVELSQGYEAVTQHIFKRILLNSLTASMVATMLNLLLLLGASHQIALITSVSFYKSFKLLIDHPLIVPLAALVVTRGLESH